MQKLVGLVLISFTLFQGCSVYIASQRKEQRRAIISSMQIGSLRADVIKALGEPRAKEGEHVDFYSLCIPEPDEPGYNTVIDIATVGLWEIWATPYELSRTCENEKDVAIIYDDKMKLLAVLNMDYYGEAREAYTLVLGAVEELDKKKNQILLDYQERIGWFYVNADTIRCPSEGNRVKADITMVLSLMNAMRYKSLLDLQTAPISIHKTIMLDMKSRQVKGLSSDLYDKNGEIVTSLMENRWDDVSSGSFTIDMIDKFTHYCLTGAINEAEKWEKPILRDSLMRKGSRIAQ
ncbi:hypothetical protein ACFL9T_14270 [Thermodesulfobacteriota bacterium]